MWAHSYSSPPPSGCAGNEVAEAAVEDLEDLEVYSCECLWKISEDQAGSRLLNHWRSGDRNDESVGDALALGSISNEGRGRGEKTGTREAGGWLPGLGGWLAGCAVGRLNSGMTVAVHTWGSQEGGSWLQ